MRPEQLTEPLAQCETVYVPAELLEKLDLNRWAEMTHICAVLPRIFRTEDQAALRALLQQHRQHLSAVAIGNLGHLPIAESLGLPLWGDLGLNLFNSESLLFWKELGLESAAVSMELRWQQLRDLRKVLPCEAVVYGRLPLMIMENCVIRNELGCRDAGRDYADRSPAWPVRPGECPGGPAPGRSSPWWASGATGARSRTVKCCSWRISRSGGSWG